MIVVWHEPFLRLIQNRCLFYFCCVLCSAVLCSYNWHSGSLKKILITEDSKCSKTALFLDPEPGEKWYVP